MIAWTIIIILVILLFKKYLKYKKNVINVLDKVPGPKANSLIGNVLLVATVPRLGRLKHHTNMNSIYGPLVRLWYLWEPYITIYSPEYVEAIPAGTWIQLNIYRMHRQQKFFPNPDKFDPMNFSAENCAKRYPYAYVPFSAGIRNCIGQKFAMMETKLMVVNILRKYKISTTKSVEDLCLIPEITLIPDNGVYISLERRDSRN